MPIPNTYATGLFPNKVPQEETPNPPEETDVGFLSGLEHSALVNYLRERGISEGIDPDDSDYVPDEETIRNVYEQVNYNKTAANHILDRATRVEDIQPLIDNYKNQVKYTNKVAKAGMVDSFMSSLGGMLGNPADLAFMAVTGGASSVPKAIATGAVMSLGHSVAEEEGTGIEQDVTYQTVLGGAVFGGLIGGAKFIKGMQGIDNVLTETATKSDLINKIDFGLYQAGGWTADKIKQTAQIVSKLVPDPVKESSGELLQKLKNANPFWSLEGARDTVVRLQETRDDILDKIFISQKGRKTSKGYAQAKEGEITAEELLNDDAIHQRRISDKGQAVAQRMAQEYDPEVARQALFDAIEGHMPSNSAVHKIEGFDDLVTDIKGYLKHQKVKLESAGVKVGDFGENYFPFRPDWNRVKNYMMKLYPKATAEGATKLLTQRVAKLLLKSLENPEDAQRLKDFFLRSMKDKVDDVSKLTQEDFLKWAKKQASKDARGYVNQSKDTAILTRDDPFMDYAHERTPWNHRYTDKDGFCVDQIRVDPLQTLNAYGRRTTGDYIASSMFGAKASKGISVREALRQHLAQYTLKEATSVSPSLRDSQAKAVERVMDAVERAIYRTTNREFDEASGLMSAISDIARNLSFFTANGYMGLLNLTEQAEAVKAYGGTFLIKSIPGLSKLFSSWSQGIYTPEWRRSFQNMVFGNETRGLRLWGETLARAEYKYGEGSLSARLVAGSAQLAEWSPLTKFLNATQENIVQTARDEFLGEYLRFLGSAKNPVLDASKGWGRGFLSKETLRRAGVSEGDFNYLNEVMRKAFVPDVQTTGNIAFRVSDHMVLLNDPRALYTLRRLGNYISSECIQRNSLANTMLWQGSKSSPLLGLLFQFKTFALASWNNRFLKSINRFKEGDAIGQMQTHAISGVLAGMGVIAQSSLKTAGMSEDDRKKWWKRNYGIETIDEADGGTLMRFLLNTGLRSGLYAAISLPLSPLVGSDLKSTTSTAVRSGEYDPLSVEGLTEFFPATRTINSILRSPTDFANIMRYSLMENDGTYSDAEIDKRKKKYEKALLRDALNLLPNVDYLKNQLKAYGYDRIENQ